MRPGAGTCESANAVTNNPAITAHNSTVSVRPADQIAPTNAAFSPSEAAVDHARRVVAAFDEAEARGLASIQLDGQFIDYPIVQRARRVLEAVR